MKQAIAVVSFGTTYHNAAGAIAHIERAIAQAHPERDFYRAYTSGIVRRRLKERDQICIHSPLTLLKTLVAQGYEDILVQPTHVIPGLEYEKLILAAEQFAQVRVCKPLLWQETDYEECVRAVLECLPALGEEEGAVLMGHGTVHFANAAYAQLEHKFRAVGCETVFVGTVEGFPDLDYIRERMRSKQLRKLYLLPFMIVAGDHAQNDLAGDEPDSWNNILRADGYETEVILEGLGNQERIIRLFVEHSREA